ncbi:MAG: ACT domain-containing protein [Syntrophales bacterium]|jgi:D-3-phosphoglycerate dehydrogenase|nr:ACT domain-containing protein [Syntrophales bacterium]
MSVLGPYISLGEQLGKFQAQFVTGGIQKVDIEYSGEITSYDVAPITISILKGLLRPILNEEVNDINAPIIAKERGIRVVESRSSKIEDYATLITLKVQTASETSVAAGTIFGRKDLRIVRINKFSLDVIPEGHMLVLSNQDKPGVVGNIGTILGQNNINIARLHLSRELVDQQALVVLSTDSTVSEDILAKLRSLPHVIAVTYLEM